MSSPSLKVSNIDRNLLTPPASDAGAASDSGREDDKGDREMFSALEKPRTRYDVEVITKLVVYAGECLITGRITLSNVGSLGIAWVTVEGNPMLFEGLGLV
jgi:hypothetical protein